MLLIVRQLRCKSCVSLVGRLVILFYLILAQGGKMFAQFLYRVLFYFILVQMGNRLKSLQLRRCFGISVLHVATRVAGA